MVIVDRDRRRYPRLRPTALDVTIKAMGSEWRSRAVDLSPYGVKVSCVARSKHVPCGAGAQLRFPLAGQTPLSLSASIVRTDPDGLALEFVGLGDHESRQVKDYVFSLVQWEWQKLVEAFQAWPRAGSSGTPFVRPRFPPGRPAGDRAGRPLGAPDPPVSTRERDAERDRWQVLLDRLGMRNLHLPSGGTLAQEWQDFLTQFETEEERTDRARGWHTDSQGPR